MTTKLSDNALYKDITAILQAARSNAYRAVNTAMVDAYWLIGKRIIEEEQQGENRAQYGHELIKNLSIVLNAEFGNGFSIANLKNFRQFYLTFIGDEKGYTLCSSLSWSHIRLIMRIDDTKVRHYYLTESKAENWSVRQLQRNMQSHYYERLLSSQNKNNAINVLTDEQPAATDVYKRPLCVGVSQFTGKHQTERVASRTCHY